MTEPTLRRGSLPLCLAARSAEETQRLEAVFKATPATGRRAVVEDLVWALMTSREFLFQH